MKQKKMTPAARAKLIREMADSISVRNHIFTMVNTGRIPKDQRGGALSFLDYIDGEVLKGCLQVMPAKVEPVKSSTNSDFVQAREKKQAERAATTKKSKETAEKEKSPKGAFRRAQ